MMTKSLAYCTANSFEMISFANLYSARMPVDGWSQEKALVVIFYEQRVVQVQSKVFMRSTKRERS